MHVPLLPQRNNVAAKFRSLKALEELYSNKTNLEQNNYLVNQMMTQLVLQL